MKTDRLQQLLARTLLTLALISVCASPHYAQTSRSGKSIDSIITQKAFPFYAHVVKDKTAANVIRSDAALKDQSLRQAQRARKALEQCTDVACYATAVQWSPDEIAAISGRLVELFRSHQRMQPLLETLRAEDRYSLHHKQAEAALIRSIWNDAAAGVNRMLDTYIKGKKPRYPAIDAISFPENDPRFKETVRRELADLLKQPASKELFFNVPLQLALKALALNGRDEAARYEPLDQGINKSAVESIRGIQWSSFPYSIILVPGKGPDQEGVVIDPLNLERCRTAAERYHKGLAPLLFVSGGHVHPNKTPYCEAVEMKKYLIQELKIPEKAILIDPHARHTTTNMRNIARVVYRLGIPAEMKILSVTDPAQNSFLGVMEKRFMDELGYLPYRDLKKLSAEETEFYPTKNALQANPLDPLDP